MTSLHILDNNIHIPTQNDLLHTVRNNQGMQNYVPVEELDEMTNNTTPNEIPRGNYIDLKYKQLPSEQLFRSDDNNNDKQSNNNNNNNNSTQNKVVHIATANITALQNKLNNMPEEMWEDSVQREHGNATLTRAAHDRIGIRKIVFIFSDDILSTVLRHPWWKTWQNELRPIFESVNINPNRLIRCMLARIPPKTHIGMHHDTGRWTTLSHRMHIPIFTNVNKVVFRSGNTTDQMERFAFHEGECFELNNRAKHQVYNGWDKHRIHLIFDWVPDNVAKTIEFINLSKGQYGILSRRAYIGIKEDEDNERKDETKNNMVNNRILKVKSNDIVNGTNSLWEQLVEYFSKNVEKNDENTAINQAKQFLIIFKQYCLGEILVEDLFKSLQNNNSVIDDDFMYFIETNLVLACSDNERRFKLQQWFKHPTQTFDLDLSNLRQNKMKTNLSRPPMCDELTENPIPSFIILGMMKCGTTSLFQYIMDHPYAYNGRQKEPHVFDWRYERINKTKLTKEQQEKSIHFLQQRGLENPSEFQQKITCFFDTDEMILNKNSICGDGSPSYILGGKLLAKRIKDNTPNSRLIIILRDPIKRCCSHYNMMKDKMDRNLGDKTFKEVVLDDIQRLRSCGINPEDGVDNIDLDVFERDYLRSLPYGHGSHSYVGRGLYILLIKVWISEFKRENILILRLEEMVKNVQNTMDVVYEYLGLPPHVLEDTNARNARVGGYKVDFNNDENKQVMKILEEFYKPFNEKLEELLS